MTAVLPPISPVGPDYRIVLVSLREPSGVSWIINCLLELGIRVDLQPTVDQIFGFGQQPASAMWLPEADGRWRLHPRASALTKMAAHAVACRDIRLPSACPHPARTTPAVT